MTHRSDIGHSGSLAADLGTVRIALFSGNYNCVRDGANQALNRLVGFLLDRAGAKVRVYSPTVSNPAFEPTGTLVSVPSIGIPGRGEYRFALGLTEAPLRDLARFCPDIVHLSAPDRLGRQAQRYAQRRGIPVVTSFHTRFERYFDYYGLSILKGWAVNYLHRFYSESDWVLVPNEPIAEELRNQGLGARISVWGRGVDRSIFSPARRDTRWRQSFGYADDEPVVMFFGRLVREKGLETFAATIQLLRAMGHSIRPLVIGDGPDKQRFARQLPTALFLGELEGLELGRAVASADILLNPSVTEAFGNVTLEAMAAGVAVVSADVPSARALLQDRRSGILVPAGDIELYANAVAGLIRDPQLRRELAHAALVEAQSYDWDDILQEVISVYAACRRLKRHLTVL